MAYVLKRADIKELIGPVDPNGYDPLNWLIISRATPALLLDAQALLAGSVPVYYWNIGAGDSALTEMLQAEKDAVDALRLPGEKVNRRRALSGAANGYLASRGYPLEIEGLFLGYLADARHRNLSNRTALIVTWGQWVNSIVDAARTVLGQINAAATMTELDAVTWDFSAFDSTDPGLTRNQILMTTD